MILFYALYASIGFVMSGLFRSFPDIWAMLSLFLSYNITAVLITYLLIDPCIILLVTLLTKYPPQTKLNKDTKSINKADKNSKTALIITCHNSNLKILERTIKSALIHFLPQNIHIADNGNDILPSLALCRMVKLLDTRINYRYTKIGNKTLAQYLACR
jgi:hypothetical protein